jgi:Flp pilus assembly pilin Flp
MTPAKPFRARGVRRARRALLRRLRAEIGASAVEYAILVAMIAAVIVVVVAALGVDVHDLFDSLHF